MARTRPRYSEAARAAVRQAYYNALCGHEPFKVALQTLFEPVYRTFADAHARWWRLPAEERKYHRPRSARELARAIQEDDARGSTPYDEACVRDFVEMWRLPTFHTDEVWACLYRVRENILYSQEPLRLVAHRPRPEGVTTAASTTFTWDVGTDPSTALDGLRDDRALAEQMRQQRHETVERLRRSALPPQLWDRQRVEAIGRRLFDYAILRRSFKMIAESESVEPHAVAESVHVWAHVLGIVLPWVRRGRPRGRK